MSDFEKLLDDILKIMKKTDMDCNVENFEIVLNEIHFRKKMAIKELDIVEVIPEPINLPESKIN